MDDKGEYFVQCKEGDHVLVAVEGSDIEARCIARNQRGLIDALTILREECPACIEGWMDTVQEWASEGVSAPFPDPSPYEGQLVECGEPVGTPLEGVFYNGEQVYLNA